MLTGAAGHRLLLPLAARLEAPMDRRPTVVPARYDLRLEPDLERATFAGEETVAVTVVEAVSAVVLHAAELEIQSVAAESADGVVLQGTAALDPAAERARLVFPAPL